MGYVQAVKNVIILDKEKKERNNKNHSIKTITDASSDDQAVTVHVHRGIAAIGLVHGTPSVEEAVPL